MDDWREHKEECSENKTWATPSKERLFSKRWTFPEFLLSVEEEEEEEKLTEEEKKRRFLSFSCVLVA